jgi:hypothetical protein
MVTLTRPVVAQMLGVSQEWVRAHAPELGAVRLGNGPRGALRFDIEGVRRLMETRRVNPHADAPARQRGRPRAASYELLPLPDGAR